MRVTNQIHPPGPPYLNPGWFPIEFAAKQIQIVGYESENEQISSDFEYVNVYYTFDNFGTCTNIILQVFVYLEVLKSTPLRGGVWQPKSTPCGKVGGGYLLWNAEYVNNSFVDRSQHSIHISPEACSRQFAALSQAVYCREKWSWGKTLNMVSIEYQSYSDS